MNQRVLFLLVLALPLAAQLPPACSPYGDKCLYTPAAVRFGSSSIEFSYQDAAGLPRAVPVQVRMPASNQPGSAALPVMVWSDDAPGEWSDITAAAGYLTVTVGYTPRDESQQTAICTALKVPDGFCKPEDVASWDRANDLSRAVAALEAYNASGPAEIRGRIDLARVAVGGFAEGGSAALSIAGARRLLQPSAKRTAPDMFNSSRPVAFVILSPPTPANEGFYDTNVGDPTHSWTDIKRPVLTITGTGDNNCLMRGECISGHMSSMRSIMHALIPAGDKYTLVFNTLDLDHDFIGSLDTAACREKGVAATRCGDQAAWMRASVLGFLDAKVRAVASAATWLDNGLIRPASSNIVQFKKK